MLTARDKHILRFMEKVNLGLTINQAALMFFPKTFGYDYARQRLRKLWQMKVIKKYTNNFSNELIYYFDKKPNYHDNTVLNVYANFVNYGYKIEYFKNEQQWIDGSIRSDGFLIADNPQEKRYVIIEVDINSVTNIEKYEILYETEFLQREYGVFPMILILSDVQRNYKSDNFEVIQQDIKCLDFYKILI